MWPHRVWLLIRLPRFPCWTEIWWCRNPGEPAGSSHPGEFSITRLRQALAGAPGMNDLVCVGGRHRARSKGITGFGLRIDIHRYLATDLCPIEEPW